MTLRISYDKARLAALKRRLREMEQRSKDCSPAWGALLSWFADRNFQQFLSRGGEYRTPWKPLAESTILEKRRQGWPLDPLIRTGELAHSITLRPLNIEHVTPRAVTAGTRNQKAIWQHFGTQWRGRQHIPPRPLFSATQIKASHAATYACANWIIDGKRSVRPRRTSVRVRG